MRLPLNAPVPIPVVVVRDDWDWFVIACAVLSVVLALIAVLQARAMRRNDQPIPPERPSDVEPGAPPRLIEAHRYIPPDVLGAA